MARRMVVGRNHVKTVVGWMIVIGHASILLYIFLGKSDVWDVERQISAALTVAPVSAVYFASVVKSFILGGAETGPGESVNINFALVSFLVPFGLLVGVFYIVHAFPNQEFSKPERLQQALAGLEVCLGGVVGFVIDNLFPRGPSRR